jgi:hypothetical protein
VGSIEVACRGEYELAVRLSCGHSRAIPRFDWRILIDRVCRRPEKSVLAGRREAGQFPSSQAGWIDHAIDDRAAASSALSSIFE